ncbi:pleckstrin homology-like domain family B member 3 isoform X3 [Malaclemys terrapin pileata]|uniref:pleckstrin homology-like domain family B member 3 isoform X3 n=1 Tax=Malaclemys terrapin pileata TaxID=2991368 RepID=UPI0023A838E8|nr:pleckstrin homology-like domain family B member 3 isoform X3 [Malaclemys terrapin pileata]
MEMRPPLGSLAMVLPENEPLAGLSQTSRCPVLAPVGQDRWRGPFPAQGPEPARAQPVGGADCLSSGPGGAMSDSPEEDEASSTESAQNGDESPQAGAEGSRLRGEQDKALGRVAELESCIKELQHQQKEMNIEQMKLEGALLEGELAAEWREVQREEQLVLQLQRRFAETVHRCHIEREKEKARLGKERLKVEELQRQHAESQTHLETQPESMRERMQSQLQQTSEMLEGALKSYEDLEFQQLERESRLEEEKEEACQALARQVAQVQERLKERKRKVRRLEAQVRSLQEHMAGECHKLAQEKGEAVQSLNLERRRLEELGKVCEDESRDDSPVSNQELTKLMFTQKTDRKVVVLGCDQRDPACVFSVRSSVQSSFGLQRSRSLPRRRGDRLVPRPTQRPLSLEANGGLDSDVLALQLSAGGDQRCVPLKHLNAPLYPLGGPYSVSSCVTKLAEMERMVREAMAERERLLQAREAKRVAQGETQHTEPPPPAQDRSPGPSREPPAPAPVDLRAHLEASGHSLETCPEVRVTGRACRGFLVKMGGRIKTWKKRWFCFDRQRRLLAYYVDKEEAKLKGVIYFQAIEEVYYDHLRSAFKSPNPKLTFCVKTYDRLFCLVAPSAEAMRIWMDAIVTAAEENTRY